uniref:Alternative protein DPT n=1 Tax=Homo sapiens TaxID=9606 RepID=L8E7N7_HUMAN|nr:alternative protein DPT [Homo sapiens]
MMASLHTTYTVRMLTAGLLEHQLQPGYCFLLQNELQVQHSGGERQNWRRGAVKVLYS